MNSFSLKSKQPWNGVATPSEIVMMEHLADLWPYLKDGTKSDIREQLESKHPKAIWHLDYWLANK
jgi:hypothetical protein